MICSKCGEEKCSIDFEFNRRQCRTCRAAMKKISRRNWYLKNKERLIQYSKDWREHNPDKKVVARKAEYARNRNKAIIASRIYRANNRAKVNAWSRKRQQAKANRLPIWLTSEDLWLIEQAYELAALRTRVLKNKWEVDHIIPLRGKLVSGLHVIENLQVIPAVLNKLKRNSYNP